MDFESEAALDPLVRSLHWSSARLVIPATASVCVIALVVGGACWWKSRTRMAAHGPVKNDP